MLGEGIQRSLFILTHFNQLSNSGTKTLDLVSKIGNEKFRFFELIVMKMYANKVKILNENVDKQSQNTHVEVNIFARQKSEARNKVWIAQNNLHITQNSAEILQLF